MRKSKATEALRVAQEVDAIRLALKKRGYSLRKRPKQPVWTVYITPEHCYQLSYQPAPISRWVLYPQNSDSSRHALLSIIQGVLSRQPAGIAGKVS
ncbi:MAG TPA: hypothetical protein V6D11_29395 [Waterburya sp.]|jgi:hypothetical protein